MTDLEFQIDEAGDVLGIYNDSLLPLYNELGTLEVHRASNVEFEDGGWSVRSHHDPKKALRLDQKRAIIVGTEGPLAVFKTREEALFFEVKNFWELIKND